MPLIVSIQAIISLLLSQGTMPIYIEWGVRFRKQGRRLILSENVLDFLKLRQFL
jgi:hypothetical protein